MHVSCVGISTHFQEFRPCNHLRNVIQVPGHQRIGWAKLRTQQVFSIYGFYKQKVEVRLKHA